MQARFAAQHYVVAHYCCPLSFLYYTSLKKEAVASIFYWGRSAQVRGFPARHNYGAHALMLGIKLSEEIENQKVEGWTGEPSAVFVGGSVVCIAHYVRTDEVACV